MQLNTSASSQLCRRRPWWCRRQLWVCNPYCGSLASPRGYQIAAGRSCSTSTADYFTLLGRRCRPLPGAGALLLGPLLFPLAFCCVLLLRRRRRRLRLLLLQLLLLELQLGQAPLPVPQQHGNRPSAYFSHDPIFSHGDRLSLTQACKRCTSRYIHGHGPPPSLCIAPLLLSVIPQPRQLPLSCRGESGRHPGSAFTEQLRITHEGPSLNRWSCHDALGTRGWESSQDTRTPTNNILPLTNPTSLAN